MHAQVENYQCSTCLASNLNILRTGVLTSVATLARLLSGFLVMKLVAVLAGPEGVAQLGQFMSLTALLVVFAGGGIGPGVVKYLAEFRDQDGYVKTLLSSAFCFSLVSSLVMCVGVVVLSERITVWLLGDLRYQSLIVILAFAQIFVALHNLIIAIVNGMMDVKRLAAIHVGGAVIGVLAPLVLGYFFQLYGVLLAFLLAQAALLIISFTFFRRSSYFSWGYFKLSWSKQEVKKLSRYSLMTLTSALLAPLLQIMVRNILADRFSWEQVGYWQAVSKVSEAYLLFITMAISVYYLPKLSAINDKKKLIEEIKTAYKYLIPVVSALALGIYCFRDLITWILFSDEFADALYLYAPQLIGDVIKVASFILSFIMLAKAMTKTFLFSEIFFGLTYVALVYWFTAQFGLIGSMYAFAINYFLYFLFTFSVAVTYVRGMK
ncbi:O-antigen translocase [Pseudomonas sp. IPO3778]|uniref:O-antigen translocase n=1 Tax=Pseudomonas sp. IPO3778 TaxID=2726976 RepID=UPI002810D119|nr:O-antigen translocase [Pseudomonas sp. IPO3778]